MIEMDYTIFKILFMAFFILSLTSVNLSKLVMPYKLITFISNLFKIISADFVLKIQNVFYFLFHAVWVILFIGLL